jgi:hypothetical protein
MGDNVIDGFRHAIKCPFVHDRSKTCDCHPIDESKAMRSADVLRVFSPLPEHEAAELRKYIGR